MIFDGREFAKQRESQVKARVASVERKPKIVSILVGSDPASELYTRLKKEAAERVGIDFSIEKLDLGDKIHDLCKQITEIGKREEVDGVMVQMPLPGLSREEQTEVIQAIPLEKDVDGLRWEESGVMPATVRAIFSILGQIADLRLKNQDLWSKKFVVVGSHGSVGRPLVHFLRERGVNNIHEINSDTEHAGEIMLKHGDVIVSCVGKAGLITEEMVRPDTVAVDVGISRINVHKAQMTNVHKLSKKNNLYKTVGDMTEGAYKKVAVAVPVPGGVGPVTVASLMENTLR